jgi:hypothetical protein
LFISRWWLGTKLTCINKFSLIEKWIWLGKMTLNRGKLHRSLRKLKNTKNEKKKHFGLFWIVIMTRKLVCLDIQKCQHVGT